MTRSGMAALGAGALAVACCAALPSILAVMGGLTIAGVLGAAGGVLAVGAVTVGVRLIRARRGMRC